jgi:hypothetical protein
MVFSTDEITAANPAVVGIGRSCSGPDPQRSAEEAVQVVRCFGYVEGVVSAVIRLSVAGFMTDPLYEGTFCFPETTEPHNWIESFVAWADRNPEKLETPAVDGFLLALIEAFPCDGSAPSGLPANSP